MSNIITIIGLILIGVSGVAYVVYNQMNKNKATTNSKKKQTGFNEEEDKGMVKRKEGKEVPKKNIFDFMEFDKIIDNMIVQEKGNKYTMVIQCKGINYDLMSEVEQLSVEEGFITFLNTLKFPVQLYVQARAVDLKKSMNIFQNSVNELEKKYNDAEDLYKKTADELNVDFQKVKEAKDERDKYFRILDYAEDITRYVERISLNKHVLQRKFYIVLSYYKSEVNTTSKFNDSELHDICFRELYTRAQTLISSLATCSVTGKVLNSNELAELLYISYNRDDEKLMDIRSALDSGFYRLYSTSKDVFEKKEELMEKEIQEEALQRVRDAVNETLKMQDVKSSDELVEEFEERADSQALNIINTANLDEEAKETLSDIIAEKHVIGVEERKEKRRLRDQLLSNSMVEQIAVQDNNNKKQNVEEKNDNSTENATSIVNNENIDIDLTNNLKGVEENTKDNTKNENIESKENQNITVTNTNDFKSEDNIIGTTNIPKINNNEIDSSDNTNKKDESSKKELKNDINENKDNIPDEKNITNENENKQNDKRTMEDDEIITRNNSNNNGQSETFSKKDGSLFDDRDFYDSFRDSARDFEPRKNDNGENDSIV